MKKINELQGYENVLDVYYISKDGKVYSEKIKDFCKIHDNGKGYKVVSLKLKNCRKYKKEYVHRLVAKAFISNPKGLKEVNHKDENKSNNIVSNLEWCDRKYNNTYGSKIERMINKKCYCIYVYDFKLNFIGEYKGISNATLNTIGIVDTRLKDKRGEKYIYSTKKDIQHVINILNNSKYKTVVLHDVAEDKYEIYPTTRTLRKHFGDKINVTNAIKNKWLVRKKYRIFYLDYNKLKDSPNLQEMNCKK